jgi:hypothetical protein
VRAREFGMRRIQSLQEISMTPGLLFQTQLVLGYVAWLACFRIYMLPKLSSMPGFEAHRAIAALHSFRIFGLAFIMPGVVGPALPGAFAQFAAYGDLATGLLAISALVTAGVRPLFWLFVVAFNVVGLGDLLLAYYHAVHAGLPEVAGQLGATYAVPIVYVPLLMITHICAIYWLRPASARRSIRSGPPARCVG